MHLPILIGAVLGMTNAVAALPTAATGEVSANDKRTPWLLVYGGQGKNAYNFVEDGDEAKSEKRWELVYGGQGKNAYDFVEDGDDTGEVSAKDKRTPWLLVYGGQGKNAYNFVEDGDEAAE